MAANAASAAVGTGGADAPPTELTYNATRSLPANSSASLFAFKKPKLKSASINRTFLQSTVAPTASSSGSNNTVGGSTGTAVRPRLTTRLAPRVTPKAVVVGASSAINAITTTSTGTATGAGSAAGGVGLLGAAWGSKKPALVREYTDEELLATHGIHLVHRLSVTSDDDKAGKWDEMDDETDWSDTIEFADGTKFTLPTVSKGEVEDESVSASTNGTGAVGSANTICGADGTGSADSADSAGSAGSFASAGIANDKIVKTLPEVAVTATSPLAAGLPAEKAVNIVSKEERFSDDHYDRSWHAQRPNAPQIYNVHTGRFDLVDGSSKNSKRALKKSHSDKRSKTRHHLCLLSRRSTKKDELEPLAESSTTQTMNNTGDVAPASTNDLGLLKMGSMSIMDDIETFQRAIMIDAKEKARLRREEEEQKRQLQQERAKKKAEALAKLSQKTSESETVKEEKNSSIETEATTEITPSYTSVTPSQTPISSSIQNESKTCDIVVEKKNEASESSSYPQTSLVHSSTQPTIELNKTDSIIPITPTLENNTHAHLVQQSSHISSKSSLKKMHLTVSTESHPSIKKEGKTSEFNKHINSKQKHSKTSYTHHPSNINDNWRKERTNTIEKNLNKICLSLKSLGLEETSIDASNTSSDKKKPISSIANKSSEKSSPSHSRTSSRFFPSAQPNDAVKLEHNKNDSSTTECSEKQALFLTSETSLNTATHSDVKPPVIILSSNTQTFQNVPTYTSKRPSSSKTIPATSSPTTTISASATTPTSPFRSVSPRLTTSQPMRCPTRPSTRSFDDVMEQLARAGNFSQNDEKFASHLPVSKSQPSYMEKDILSVTTISPFELEKYSKNTINVSLHSNELFNMPARSVANKNDTKPFVNIPATSSYVFTSRPSYPVEQSKYFESPYQHTMDFSAHEEQEIDTLRLYLPETSPRHIKIKASSTFLHRKTSKNTHLPLYNTSS